MIIYEIYNNKFKELKLIFIHYKLTATFPQIEYVIVKQNITELIMPIIRCIIKLFMKIIVISIFY